MVRPGNRFERYAVVLQKLQQTSGVAVVSVFHQIDIIINAGSGLQLRRQPLYIDKMATAVPGHKVNTIVKHFAGADVQR
jgi:hypothetical protein